MTRWFFPLIRDEPNLVGLVDEVIWVASQNENRLLITQDLDFSDSRKFRPGSHCGIILVRMRSPGRNAMFEKVSQLFKTEDVHSWQKCFVVATDRKVRVNRPA